jgi:signal transduction histidine kinase
VPGSKEPRHSTDESLRAERDRADVALDSRLEKVERRTDQAVRSSRQVEDSATQTARDEADGGQARSSKEEGLVDASREQDDVEVERKRQVADAAVGAERLERRHSMEAFLAGERTRTDEDLVQERAESDTMVVARDQVLANVSHDLGNLMGGLSLTAGLLEKAVPDGEAGALLRKLTAATSRYVVRMSRLLNDLQDIATIEAGRLQLVRGPVQVARLLDETLLAFEPVAAARQVRLHAAPTSVGLQASLDDERTLQVLANLVSNAIKFTQARGQVSLAVTGSAEGIHFTVRDTGVGIPADQLEKVFDRYRQVSKDRRGLGLGLHISRQIVEAHGGRMWAESELGVGSALHFVLPA